MKRNNQASHYTEFFYKAFRNILLVSVPLAIISVITLSFIPHSSASTDQIEFSLSISCTMSSTINSAHAKSIANSTYHSDVGKTTITTLCNDNDGYSVYANGYSNNEEGNNKLINSSYPQYSIDTGLATSGLTSTWAMKLNNIENDPSPTPPTIESAYNNTYGIVPAYWTKVASRASGTTDMAQGSSFTTTYAVYASSSQFTGTYQGQVKYVLTHPSYQPYVYYMQEVDKWKNTIAMGESVEAIDIRDGKKYWVTKLEDNNIWMTQNLDLDLDTNTKLNSETTDLNVIYNPSTEEYVEYANGYTVEDNIIYWTPVSNATTIHFTETTVTGWQISNTEPSSADKTDSTETGHTSPGNWYNWSAAIASNDSSSFTINTLNDISKNPQNSICPKGWRLPTISNQSETITGSANEFARLNYLYNNNKTNTDEGLIKAPLWFTKNGVIYLTLEETNNGFYQSSSTNNASYAYYLFFNNTRVGEADYWTRSSGRNIRCIAK